jgi:hypothetical protein
VSTATRKKLSAFEFLLTLSASDLYFLAVFTIHRDRQGGCHFEANSHEANVSTKPQKASQQAWFSRPHEVAKWSQNPRPAAPERSR